MIDATTENIWYKKKKRRFFSKRSFCFLIILSLIVGCVVYYKSVVTYQIINICEDYAYAYSTDAVNKAVLKSLSNSIRYDDLITIEKNSNGDIVLMSTDSLKINTISREIAESTKSILDESMLKGASVPLFAFTGIGLLAGYGKPVMLKTLSVSSVICEFDSKFESVGINQTLHSIYILVNSKIFIEMPFYSKEIDCQTSVIIGESVLLGKVPEIYLNGKLFS